MNRGPVGRRRRAPPPATDTEGGRLVLGIQAVNEALRVHGTRVLRLLGDPANPRVAALLEHASSLAVNVEQVGPGVLDRMARGARHQGVAALVPELEVHGLDKLGVPEDCPLVVLDGVTDPQNFGAVIRASVALGRGAVLWAEHGAAPLTAATFRASAGAIEHARLFRVRSLHGAVVELGERGVQTLLLDGSASATIDEVELSAAVAVVVGSEDRGARRSVRRACSTAARLPMTGRIGSLNASVAAAIALYELARRQRAVLDASRTLPAAVVPEAELDS